MDLSACDVSQQALDGRGTEARSRTEAGEVRKLRRVVRHGAHDPVRRRLPHCVENAAHDEEHYPPNVSAVIDVILVIAWRNHLLTCVFPAGSM